MVHSQEVEELMDKGIRGSGQGFDAASVGRLGSHSYIPQHNPSAGRLRDVMLQVRLSLPSLACFASTPFEYYLWPYGMDLLPDLSPLCICFLMPDWVICWTGRSDKGPIRGCSRAISIERFTVWQKWPCWCASLIPSIAG